MKMFQIVKHVLLSTLIFSTIFGAENRIFPDHFLKGCSFSAYQNGGHFSVYHYAGSFTAKSNWSWFEEQKTHFNMKHLSLFKPTSVIEGQQKIGRSTEFYDRAFDDIKLLKNLEVNAVRFSFEWADYEVEEGVFREDYLDFFEDYIDALIKNGIQPMITLHHFVHPLWFEQKGGFTKSENIFYFVRYCQRVFARLGNKAKLWCTINEPTVVSACGYVLGIHPPGKVFNFNLAGTVLLNLLKAHVEVYKKLKAMPNGKEAQIGIVHQLLTFQPYQHTINTLIRQFTIYNPIGSLIAPFFNFAFGNETVKEFFKTGHFNYTIPFIGKLPLWSGRFCNVVADIPDAPQSFDFFGINIYSRVIVSTKPTCYPSQVMTDMEYPSSPELVYDAIVEMSELGKPMYITENGIADKHDTHRAQFIRTAEQYVHKALEEGYDIRGYFYWTLMDNYEWNDAFSQHFGLYAVNRDTRERTLRPGGSVFKDCFST
jgi:beta-glucosidase